jgi:hypothetical protein
MATFVDVGGLAVFKPPVAMDIAEAAAVEFLFGGAAAMSGLDMVIGTGFELLLPPVTCADLFVAMNAKFSGVTWEIN